MDVKNYFKENPGVAHAYNHPPSPALQMASGKK